MGNLERYAEGPCAKSWCGSRPVMSSLIQEVTEPWEVRLQDTCDDIEQRGLARAVGSDQAGDGVSCSMVDAEVPSTARMPPKCMCRSETVIMSGNQWISGAPGGWTVLSAPSRRHKDAGGRTMVISGRAQPYHRIVRLTLVVGDFVSNLPPLISSFAGSCPPNLAGTSISSTASRRRHNRSSPPSARILSALAEFTGENLLARRIGDASR